MCELDEIQNRLEMEHYLLDSDAFSVYEGFRSGDLWN